MLLAAILAVACFVVDQASKSWALHSLSATAFAAGAAGGAMYKPFIPGFLRFVLVSNTGGAFGIAHGNNSFMMLLAAAVVIAVIVWAARRQLNVVQHCGVGILIGGAIGNLWDRVLIGHVTDFLDFAFINFPVFNMSDVFVDIGIGLILLGEVFRK